MKNDPYLKLARQTIEQFVKTGKRLEKPLNQTKEMTSKRAGIFVSIHRKDGSLRGCIGTFLPTRKNLAEEIINNAIATATQDPRFPPVTAKELDDLEISVDILSRPKLVTDISKLDPKKYGLIVSAKDACPVTAGGRFYGGRRGLLLPDIPGVESTEEQIEICRQKGGISPEEPVRFQIFTVERHNEKD